MLTLPRKDIHARKGEYEARGAPATASVVPNRKILDAVENLSSALATTHGEHKDALLKLIRGHAELAPLLRALAAPKKDVEWTAEVVSRDKHGRVQQVRFTPK